MNEHWRCPECGTLDGPITVRACDVCADEGRAIDVEALVPASQLEGAVEALRDIQQAVRTQSVKARAADYCERRATEALDQLGGR